MRIGIDARFYGPAGKGIGRYIQKLIEHLEKIDKTNQYFIFLQKVNWWEYQPQNPHFQKVLADCSWYSLKEQVLMPLKIYRQGVDLMHFPHFNIPLFYRGKFITTIHDLIITHFPTERATTLGPLLYSLKRMGYDLVIRSAVRKSFRIITVSEYSKNDLIKSFHLDPKKIKVTYEAATPLPLPSKLEEELFKKWRLKKPYLLYVGNAYPHKNLERLTEVFKKLQESDKLNLNLILVGREDFFYRRLKKHVKKLGIPDRVIFTGFISDGFLPLLYREALAFIFPSEAEGFGLPPLEAFAYGLPVASSNTSSLPEILQDAALYFDPQNLEDMREKIKKIATQKDLRESLKQKGYERIKNFSWEKMAKETKAIYEQCLE